MIAKPGIAFCCLPLLFFYVNAGMDQFLRDTVYSVQSIKDDGVLTLADTKNDNQKIVILQKWDDLTTQRWVVRDFQSIGLYDFTPLIYNTSTNPSDNVVTYQLTKNVYTDKRQWKVHLLSHQRYQIQNPESGFCLTNMGMHQQVDELRCEGRLPLNQVWKLRMLPR